MARVLGLVSFRVFPTHMGGQKGVADFYRYLSERVDVVLAASYDNKDSGSLELRRVLYPNRKIYLNFFRLARLKKLVHEQKIDMLIAEHSYTGWMAWVLRIVTGRPFIIHSHNIESKRFRHMKKWWWRLYSGYEGWIHRRADHNFFISREDLDYACAHFRLDEKKCTVITYGVAEERPQTGRAQLRKILGWKDDVRVYLFNGTMDYQPNFDAVVLLVNTIEPLLRGQGGQYKIVITGNRARAPLIAEMEKNNRIEYLGYVPDINLYYQAADLFLNPIAHDTGVKTKLIEAIANGCPAVSTVSGAAGVRAELCGGQLQVVDDGDWDSFAQKMQEQVEHPRPVTPGAFYEAYGWRSITAAAAAIINRFQYKS